MFVLCPTFQFMDYDTVCAFDYKGGNIRSFAGREEAHLANYTILHCGACGHCSTWTNLELEYTTRNTLAAESQACGIKTLGRGVNALQKCLEGPTVGFEGKCHGQRRNFVIPFNDYDNQLEFNFHLKPLLYFRGMRPMLGRGC